MIRNCAKRDKRQEFVNFLTAYLCTSETLSCVGARSWSPSHMVTGTALLCFLKRAPPRRASFLHDEKRACLHARVISVHLPCHAFEIHTCPPNTPTILKRVKRFHPNSHLSWAHTSSDQGGSFHRRGYQSQGIASLRTSAFSPNMERRSEMYLPTPHGTSLRSTESKLLIWDGLDSKDARY